MQTKYVVQYQQIYTNPALILGIRILGRFIATLGPSWPSQMISILISDGQLGLLVALDSSCKPAGRPADHHSNRDRPIHFEPILTDTDFEDFNLTDTDTVFQN